MKLHHSSRRNHALTLTEMLVVIGILVLLAAVLLPALAAAKKKGCRINCSNNLKQIGLSHLIWAGDNYNQSPAEVSLTNGGAMEPALAGNAAAIFQVMSNELSTPKVLVCPNDTNSPYATNFSVGFCANNISYFFSLDAGSNNPTALLSGDDNFEIRGQPVPPGLLVLWTNTPLAWTAARHVRKGNVVFADGHVEELSNQGLRRTIQQMAATNRLAIP